jgi:hypothetical protein
MFYSMFFTKAYISPVILIYRLLSYYPSVVFGGLFALFAPEKPLKHAAGGDIRHIQRGSHSRYKLISIEKNRYICIKGYGANRT